MFCLPISYTRMSVVLDWNKGSWDPLGPGSFNVDSTVWVSLDSSFSIVFDYGLDVRCSIPERDSIFPLATASREVGGGRGQPSAQWVPGVVPPGVHHSRDVILITTARSVRRWRRTCSPSQTPPWRVAEQLYFYCPLGSWKRMNLRVLVKSWQNWSNYITFWNP